VYRDGVETWQWEGGEGGYPYFDENCKFILEKRLGGSVGLREGKSMCTLFWAVIL